MNRHTGSSFDEYLESEGILEEVSAKAHKRLITLDALERVAHAVGRKLRIEFD